MKNYPIHRFTFKHSYQRRRDFINKNVNIVNSAMRTHQSDGTYHLIDLYLHFAAEDGLMSPLLTYDGTHLNEKGYALWVSIVKPYITQK